MSTLKKQAVNALGWSFIDSIGSQSVLFLVSIVLARMLSPQEFGLMGIITIFITFSNILLEGGFTSALVRKKDCLPIDYNSVFFFNLFLGVFFFLCFFFSAGFISRYFEEPVLKLPIQITAGVLIINSFGIIQRTILIKQIAFKRQAKISLSSSILSGVLGILLAYYNWGLWALVWFMVSRQFLQTLFLWVTAKWSPHFEFSWTHFKHLYTFGINISLATFINVLYRNMYSFIIGKVYSPTTLGYYSRAEQMELWVSTNATTIGEKVGFPILSTVQEDEYLIKKGYQKLICSLGLLTMLLCFSLAAVARPLIIFLIGEKWVLTIPFLRVLAIAGIFYPMQSLNLSILNLKGKSRAHLKLLSLGRVIAVPFVIGGIFFNVYWLFAGLFISAFISYLLIGNRAGKLIDYKLFEQIKDLIPLFLVSLFVAVVLYVIGLLPLSNWILLLLQAIVGLTLTIIAYETIKNPTYLYIKYSIIEKIGIKKL